MDLPVVSVAEMRAAEERAFASGATAEQLMDEAGAGIAQFVRRIFGEPGHCIVFCGKGNNAGDALVAAAHLRLAGWNAEARFAFADDECGELCRKKRAELQQVACCRSNIGSRVVVLDGLLGIGSMPPLRDPVLSACREINRLRVEQSAIVVSADIPSGVDADTGAADADAVIADFTVSVGAAKQGLLVDGVIDHIGRLEIIPLARLEFPRVAAATCATAASLRDLLPRRNFSGYKNQFGRVGIIAGSRGLTGAAMLCAFGALRGGAGLVNLFVPEDIYEIVAAAAPSEAMVRPIKSYRDVIDTDVEIAAWAIGPGLGAKHYADVRELIDRLKQSIVLDADGLNSLTEDLSVLEKPSGPRLLTPHPGEMKRLAGVAAATRAETARGFTARYPVTLLLKGSRSIVAERNRAISYNTTGNPGMASGGMGDVLTGVCAALIAQKLSPFDAARVGAWVCGRAAELAIFRGAQSEESLIARDVVENLGRAFHELHHA